MPSKTAQLARAGLLGALLTASACANLPGDTFAPDHHEASPLDAATIRNLAVASASTLRPETLWVATSTDWATGARDVYAAATAHVTEESESRAPGTWAVVLDVDETVLNNIVYQIERDRSGTTFSPESWASWTARREAGLVPGARDFLETVRTLGGHVALVTNRRSREQFDTEANLRALGIRRGELFDVLLTRGDTGPSAKGARFALVGPLLEAQGLGDVEIIGYVGDAVGDRPANTTLPFFCIDQGGIYGEPCARTQMP